MGWNASEALVNSTYGMFEYEIPKMTDLSIIKIVSMAPQSSPCLSLERKHTCERLKELISRQRTYLVLSFNKEENVYLVFKLFLSVYR